MQTNLGERQSLCRSTAKSVSACLRAADSKGEGEKKKKKKKKKTAFEARSTTRLSNWLLLKDHFPFA